MNDKKRIILKGNLIFIKRIRHEFEGIFVIFPAGFKNTVPLELNEKIRSKKHTTRELIGI